jgi:PAS domain S-box-containing protein
MPNSDKSEISFSPNSRRLLNKIIDVVPSVVYVRDLREGKDIFISRAVTEALGYQPNEITNPDGGFTQSVMHPDDFARLPEREKIFDNLNDGEIAEFEYRMRHRNGEWRWFFSRDSVFARDESGAPVQIIGTATDITSFKTVEEKLRRSEDRFQTAFAAVQAVIYDWNIVDDTITRSAELQNLLGFANSEPKVATNKWWLSRLHPQDAERAANLIQDSIRQGADRFEDEYRLQHKDGRYLWVADSGVFLKDETGKIVRCVGSVRNINQRKEAEKALRETEERFSKAFKASPLILAISSLKTGAIIEVNDAFLKVTGYNREEVLGKNTVELGLWKNPAEREEELESVRRAGRLSNQEYVFVTKFGAEVVGLLAAETIEIDGEPFALTVIQDITQRKKAEANLAEEKRFTENIIETSPTLTYIFDFTTQSNVFISPQSLEVLGYTAQELREMGSDLRFLLIHPEDREHSRRRFENFLNDKTGETVELEYRMRRKDRNYIWIYDRSRVFRRDAFGKPTQILGVATDVTLRKAAEEARQQFVSLIEETSDFVGMARVSGEVIYTNPAGCQMVGLDKSRQPRLKIADHHPPETAKILKQIAIPQVLETGLWEGESKFKHFKTGEIIDVYQKIFPIRNPKTGELICLATTATDITERKSAEEKLRESAEIFKIASEAAAAQVYKSDLTGKTDGIAFGLERVTGYRNEEVRLTSDWWHSLIHPEDLPAHLENLERQLKSGDNYKAIHRLRRKSGEWIWVEDTGQIIRDEIGKAVQIVGAVVDIHDRKIAEEELRKSEAKYRSLFDSIDEGYCVIEMIFSENDLPIDYRFIQFNPAFTKHTGLPKDSVGKTARELVPNLEDFWFETYGRVAQTGESIRFENQSEPMNRWFDVYALRVGAPSENRVGILFNDITERKRRERNLVFLADLQAEFARLSTTAEIAETAGRRIAAQFNLSHCLFVEIDETISEAKVFTMGAERKKPEICWAIIRSKIFTLSKNAAHLRKEKRFLLTMCAKDGHRKPSPHLNRSASAHS